MRASIVIATRNRYRQLSAGLSSIAGKYDGVETVVVDDASTDGTPEVLARFRSRFPGGTFRRLERDGAYRRNPGAVFNIGHSIASSDVVIEQGGEVCHVANCVDPLLEHCAPGTVALARVFDGGPRELKAILAEPEAYAIEEDANVFSPETNGDRLPVPLVGPARLRLYTGVERMAPFLFLGAIHREDFDAVGGYDESLPGRSDEDLANRLSRRGVHFCFVGRAVALHLSHRKQ